MVLTHRRSVEAAAADTARRIVAARRADRSPAAEGPAGMTVAAAGGSSHPAQEEDLRAEKDTV